MEEFVYFIRVRVAEEGGAKSPAKMLTNFGVPQADALDYCTCTLYVKCILPATPELPEQHNIPEGHAVASK
jgi:hypothetical protein